MNTNKAAVSLIQRDGNLLCVWNRRYHGWSLPGGKVEDGETPEDAQFRELKEETGMITISAQLVYRGEHGFKVESTRGSEVYIFRVHAIGCARLIEPGCPVKWMSRDEFLVVSPFREFYKKAFTEIDRKLQEELAR